ncbi:hypothetical protein SCULI_v1c01950 [Spiroplasma culicicola AES-1]|uniref:Transmembrane protein n=1 Tax=Spiroplasma culicicola AES-1 TaxID=1276246 RepID=W6A6F3_9MOLU|nr:hypothetical protein SCULI_v1c01950 [Spiroplasma culicicola AES-1]
MLQSKLKNNWLTWQIILLFLYVTNLIGLFLIGYLFFIVIKTLIKILFTKNRLKTLTKTFLVLSIISLILTFGYLFFILSLNFLLKTNSNIISLIKILVLIKLITFNFFIWQTSLIIFILNKNKQENDIQVESTIIINNKKYTLLSYLQTAKINILYQNKKYLLGNTTI